MADCVKYMHSSRVISAAFTEGGTVKTFGGVSVVFDDDIISICTRMVVNIIT